ncbi:MAG TPA: deoxyribonuclease IV [Gemmatales bacterium]|nr:deoxyribonuclease IV [Gemmatales bacterium]
MPYFGAHMSAAGGPEQALQAAASLGMDACQLFTKNNKQWNGPPISAESKRLFHQNVREFKIERTVAHASYLINLATRNQELWLKSLHALVDELQRANYLQLDYLVVHPGTASDADEDGALQQVALAVNQALSTFPKLKTRLLLETTAGQGKSIGHTFRQLGTILERVKSKRKIGVCLDTCHIFAAGYALYPANDYRSTVDEFDQEIGLEKLHLLHVNDSVKGLGSRVDRHAALGHGSIGINGLRNILCDKRFDALAMILETPKGKTPRGEDWDAINLQQLRMLSSGRP